MKTKAFKRLVKLSAAILVLNQAVFLLSSASMALAIDSTNAYNIAQTDGDATIAPPATTTTTNNVTTAEQPVPPTTILTNETTTTNTYPTAPAVTTTAGNTTATDPAAAAAPTASLSIKETTYSKSQTTAGRIILFAVTDQIADSLVFNITSSISLTATYDSANSRYKAVWDTLSLPNGNYDISVLAKKGSLSATNNITVPVDNPTATITATTTTTIITQTPELAIKYTSYSEQDSNSNIIMLYASTTIIADSLRFKLSANSYLDSHLISSGGYYQAEWDVSNVANDTYSVEAIASKEGKTASEIFYVTVKNGVAKTVIDTTKDVIPVMATTTYIDPMKDALANPEPAETDKMAADMTATTTRASAPAIATSTATVRPVVEKVETRQAENPTTAGQMQAIADPGSTTQLPLKDPEIVPALPAQDTAEKEERSFVRQPITTQEEKKEIVKEFSKYIPLAQETERDAIVIYKSPEASEQAAQNKATAEQKEPQKAINAIIILDADGDGLPDEMEVRLGTSPINADSDGDGFNDGEEVRNGYNPIGSGNFEKELKPVEKALAKKELIEQPKLAKEASASKKIKITKVANATSSSAGSNGKNVLKFSGIARPDDIATIFIYSSMPIVVTVKTDSSGNWVYELDKTLVDGKHEAYIVINDEKGKIKEKSSPFSFLINEAQAVSNTIELPKADSNVADNTSATVAWYAIGGLGLVLLTLLGFFFYSRSRSY